MVRIEMSTKNTDKKLTVIGIAGGIGSGKSTVTDYIESINYHVYDADIEAREAVMPGEPALQKLTDYFGMEIINTDGTLNRRKLGQMAFGSAKKTRMLNEILHNDISTRIDNKIAQQAEKLNNDKLTQHAHKLPHNNRANDTNDQNKGTNDTERIAFISAPLFFEAELEKKCDQTWVVIADKEVRIRRTMERDGLPREEVMDRINRQMSDEERAEKADHILLNNGGKEALLEQVDVLLDKIN